MASLDIPAALDKPLDEIIAQKRSVGGPVRGAVVPPRGRGAFGPPFRGHHGPVVRRPPPLLDHRGIAIPRHGYGSPVVTPPAQTQPKGDKIIISNLPEDVTEDQLKELFTTTIGPLVSAVLSFDSRGISTGTATVQFKQPEHSQKAFTMFNKRLVDGRFGRRPVPSAASLDAEMDAYIKSGKQGDEGGKMETE
ncbi:hypothetical protein MNV49_006663 [Pseudohyphozyma bogoriensis]|nr:hypothetical protein MNV49_006663 [Pseudohyphozyma bogoriensis]